MRSNILKMVTVAVILLGVNTSAYAMNTASKNNDVNGTVSAFQTSKDKYFLSREIYEDVPYIVYGNINESYNKNWTEFKVNETRNFVINFQNSCMKTDYYMNLYDANFNCIKIVKQDTQYRCTLKPGTYYMKVWSKSGYATHVPYNINFLDLDKFNLRRTVPMSQDVVKNTLISSNDQKWYEVTLKDYNTVVDFYFDKEDGRALYSADIYDYNMTLVKSLLPKDSCTLPCNGGKPYYVRARVVYGYNPSAEYKLSIIRH